MRDLHKQYRAMKAEMDKAIADVVTSGRYIMGAPVKELEQKLADYVGVKHCVACASGTDALRLALMAWGVGTGDAVFVPDFTFFATAEVVAMQGATPIFVDVDADTFNVDANDLREKVMTVKRQGMLKAKAVIAVDLFGLPADYDAVAAVCRENGLLLLEDGAQGFGGRIGERRACSFGDIGATSFFPSKPLGCYGDGGAVFTDNDEWAEMMRSIRQHGKGEDKYHNDRVGVNSRLDTIQAAVLMVKLRHFDEELLMVNRVADRYRDLLTDKVKTPVVPTGYVSSWAQYTIQIEGRDEAMQRMREAEIPSAVYYPCTMSDQKVFRGHAIARCPRAQQLTQTVMSLPMHPYLSDEEINKIAAIL